MMKWILIALAVLLIGGTALVIMKGGALEMQPEHAVETPAAAPSAK